MQNLRDELIDFARFMFSGDLQPLFVWAMIGCMIFELGRRWMGYEPFFTSEEQEIPLSHTLSTILLVLTLFFSASIL